MDPVGILREEEKKQGCSGPKEEPKWGLGTSQRLKVVVAKAIRV